MFLENLAVYHAKKPEVKSESTPFEEERPWAEFSMEQDRAFYLQTCQRRLWVLKENFPSLAKQNFTHNGFDCLRGAEAYSFLLRLATGLESRVLGETDIFGQIKQQWRLAQSKQVCLSLELGAYFQALFEDCKELRAQYLQNTGGSSYGSLLRRNLKPLLSDNLNGRGQVQRAKRKVLLLGAGQLAQSVLPFLLDYSLLIWNRSPEHLAHLRERFLGQAQCEWISGISEASLPWSQVDAAIFCVPANSKQDADRANYLKLLAPSAWLVHLGGYRQDFTAFLKWDRFLALDDLFALQAESHIESLSQFKAARKACQDRSQLRSLGKNLSIAHGWEDLACFA